MADPSLRVQFWTWHETGPYFGMPIQNLVGWSLTGLLYMGVSRLLWGSDIDAADAAKTAWFPFTIYAANLVFAMALELQRRSLAAGRAGGRGRARSRQFRLAPQPAAAGCRQSGRTWRASPSR